MKNKLLLLAMGFALSTQMTIAQVPSYVPTNGLVAYYPFSGNANDLSGNGYNGTVNGAILTTDRFGITNSAYQFTSTGAVQNITTNYSGVLGKNDRSISLWYLQDVISVIDQQVLCGYGGTGVGTTFDPTTLSGRIGLDVQNIRRHYSNSIASQWNHAVFVYRGGYSISGVEVFLNGVRQNNAVLTFGNQATILNTTSGINFRINASILSQLFIGKIDDIGMWDRALTQDEITSLYQAEVSCQSLVINSGTLSSFNPAVYQSTITIYPNPANDQITIDCGNLANVSGWNIKIFNTLSQEVFSGAMNQQQYTILLNTWGGQGVYFVKIYDASNNLMNTKKIILQ